MIQKYQYQRPPFTRRSAPPSLPRGEGIFSSLDLYAYPGQKGTRCLNPSLITGIAIILLIVKTLTLLPTSEAREPNQTNPISSSIKHQKVRPLILEKENLPQGALYVLKVPHSAPFVVIPLTAKSLTKVDDSEWRIAPSAMAGIPVFIINGGFFDPLNHLTTSFITENGHLTGDPRLNAHLVNNPNLQTYLPQIFNRSEFRTYECPAQKSASSPHTSIRYDIVPHDAPNPPECTLKSALGAGPALLPAIRSQQEGFTDSNTQGKLVRDPIGVARENARSAVGLTAEGDVILIMGAQDPYSPKESGFTLEDMAMALKDRGAIKALSLDGGSSSSLFFQGKSVFGKLSLEGKIIQRPVKSVLVVIPGKLNK